LMAVGTSCPWGSSMKQLTLGVRRSKVKVTRPKIDLEAVTVQYMHWSKS